MAVRRVDSYLLRVIVNVKKIPFASIRKLEFENSCSQMFSLFYYLLYLLILATCTANIEVLQYNITCMLLFLKMKGRFLECVFIDLAIVNNKYHMSDSSRVFTQQCHETKSNLQKSDVLLF